MELKNSHETQIRAVDTALAAADRRIQQLQLLLEEERRARAAGRKWMDAALHGMRLPGEGYRAGLLRLRDAADAREIVLVSMREAADGVARLLPKFSPGGAIYRELVDIANTLGGTNE